MEGGSGDDVFVDWVEGDIGGLMSSQVDGGSVSDDGWLCSCVYPGAGVELKKGFIVYSVCCVLRISRVVICLFVWCQKRMRPKYLPVLLTNT